MKWHLHVQHGLLLLYTQNITTRVLTEHKKYVIPLDCLFIFDILQDVFSNWIKFTFPSIFAFTRLTMLLLSKFLSCNFPNWLLPIIFCAWKHTRSIIFWKLNEKFTGENLEVVNKPFRKANPLVSYSFNKYLQ